MRLLDKNSLINSLVESDFFPFFHTENCFSDQIDLKKLSLEFPQIDKGGSFPSSELKNGLLKELVEELEGEEFKGILESKFNLNLDNAKVITTLRGYSRRKDGQIHTDSKSKIITVLLYFNLNWNHRTGNLRLLKENNNLNNFIKEINSSIGNLVAFQVTDNCWHGFEPFEGKRQSIQLNYIHPNYINSHRFRHKFSSKIKQFFGSKSN